MRKQTNLLFARMLKEFIRSEQHATPNSARIVSRNMKPDTNQIMTHRPIVTGHAEKREKIMETVYGAETVKNHVACQMCRSGGNFAWVGYVINGKKYCPKCALIVRKQKGNENE